MPDPSAEEFRRADAVFDAALDVESAERSAFVARVCAGDPRLRDAVERLLRAHDREASFLDEPLVAALRAAHTDDTPPPARLGPYRLLSALGRGGMGVVYLAEPDGAPDDARGVGASRVALKVVRSGPFESGSMLRRFLAERRILASLDHPNVARLLDAGVTADGTPYFAMEYCEGGSLAERLASRGALPLGDALDVARQLAAALDAAHARGVVHRDVKPGNVLFDAEGRVRLGDFGIAKILGQDSTRSGAVLGTAAYLAPEQLQGRPVDHRADLWALGVTLYEMVGGRRPFAGDSYAAVLHAVLATEPEPLVSPHASIPDALRALVARLLAKAPAERPASADEVARLLDGLATGVAVATPGGATSSSRTRGARRWVVAIAASVLVALAGYGASRVGDSPTRASPTRDVPREARPSIAVLPFANATGDRAAAPLADGLTDALIDALGEVQGVTVTGRASVFALRGQRLDARRAATALGVASALEGVVHRSRDQLRITARLVSARDGAVLWTETYDRDTRDVLAVQEELARTIVAALRVRTTPEEAARLAARPTVDVEAYELYLQGRYHWSTRTRDGMERALGYFQQAVERDPAFALAYVGIADAYVNLTDFGFAPAADALPLARAAALRAVALDSTRAETYAALGHVLETQLEFGPAEAAFRRAIALNPRYPWAHHYYALLLAMVGRPGEALEQTRQALALDPLSPPANAYLGVVLCLQGDLDGARRQLERVVAVSPSFPLALYFLGVVNAAQRRHTDAIPALERARAQAPGFPGVLAALAYSYRATGRGAAADSVVNELRARRTDARGRVNAALAHGVLGDTDAAFRELQDAAWDIPSLLELRANPLLARLRADARYPTVLRTAGLAR